MRCSSTLLTNQRYWIDTNFRMKKFSLILIFGHFSRDEFLEFWNKKNNTIALFCQSFFVNYKQFSSYQEIEKYETEVSHKPYNVFCLFCWTVGNFWYYYQSVDRSREDGRRDHYRPREISFGCNARFRHVLCGRLACRDGSHVPVLFEVFHSGKNFRSFLVLKLFFWTNLINHSQVLIHPNLFYMQNPSV